MWVIFALAAWPLIEIALFVQIGGMLGVWGTVAWVLATGALGVMLIQSRGIGMARDMRRSMSELRDPTGPMARGAMRVVAGMLLFLPGFLTDALGLLLLLPPVQALILAALARRVSGSGFTMEFETRTRRQRPDIIDGDFHEVPPDQLPPRGRSGWQDH